MRAHAFALTAFALVSVASTAADAAVTLRSAEMTHITGSNFAVPPNPPGGSSNTTTTPFPNDATNFAGADAQGLRVVVNRTGESSGIYTQQSFSNVWDDYGFSVVFDVDAPAPFTYHRTMLLPEDAEARLTLQADGQPQVPLATFGDTSGILQPGRYTFSGDTQTRNYSGGGFFGPYAKMYSFADTRLTVVPEPGALSLLALPALALCRRRRRG